jgi:hypothetical protein
VAERGNEASCFTTVGHLSTMASIEKSCSIELLMTPCPVLCAAKPTAVVRLWLQTASHKSLLQSHVF